MVHHPAGRTRAVITDRRLSRSARELQADAYEQLGYQAEGPQWRGIYLTAAKELRDGVQTARFATASPDTILAMPIDILFDFAADFDPDFPIVTP